VESSPGNTAADHFFLVGGPIQKDLWIWDLALDDTRSNPGRANADVHVLYSRPTDIVQFTPYFGTAALTAFHSSLEPWIDRQHTLADTFALKGSLAVGLKDAAPIARTTYVDVWAAALGTHRDEDDTSRLKFFGKTFSSQMNYGQTTYGFQAGIDFISNMGGGKALMVGAFGGFLNSNVSPDTVPVRGEFEGGTVGVYASYMQGGLMLSSVVKADLLDFDWRAQVPSQDLKASSHVDTFGWRLEAAYKQFLTPGGAWFEPYANLTYAKSNWDQFTVLATTFAIDDNDSLLGRLGLRVGADVRGNQSLFKVFAGAGVAHEFKGENGADIISGGFTLPLTHKVDDTSLELQGGFKWTDIGRGLSLSITSTGRFSEDTQEYGAKATVNYQF
jgi:outer membrane autotransporter protein